MKRCVFEVHTRLKGEHHDADAMWTSYKVIAQTAQAAIDTVEKRAGEKEYAMTVKLLVELD